MGDFATARIGVEEEFHLIDLHTRTATPAVDDILARLDGEEFVPELQRSLIEANTLPCESLDQLRAELHRLRRRLTEVADPLGLGVVAAGTVPLVDLLGTNISAGARYEWMQHEYQLLVREQHICGAQIHVDAPDRDIAVGVVQHVAPHLPTFLALSASSPYWLGVDSGYASYRCVVWQRWPTAGPPGPMRTAADYDTMVADLVASGTISDAGMVYFDIRPSAHLPTVELRICDACPLVDDVVLIAGLFRALVQRARGWVAQGRPFPQIRHELLRAATWRAARSGLEGDLVDLAHPSGPTLVPPSRLIERLVSDLQPELDAFGDWKQVRELSQRALATGSSAACQRRMFDRRGELIDVVDGLLAHTRGSSQARDPPTASAPSMVTRWVAIPVSSTVDRMNSGQDVVVIGGGIAGVSIAYELAAHRRVTVLETETSLATHATGRSAAMYVPGHGGPLVRALITASGPRFASLAAELDAPGLLRSRPMLWAAFDDDGEQVLRAELAQRVGEPNAPVELSPPEALARCPALRLDVLRTAAIIEAAGELDVMALHQAYVRGLRRRGGRVRVAAPVTGLAAVAGGWQVRCGMGEVLHAADVVNAAGAWADIVASLAGVPRLGLRPLRRTIAVARVSDPTRLRPPDGAPLPMVVEAREGCYFRAAQGANLLLSPSDETPVEPGDVRPDPRDVALALERVEALTGLGLRSVHRSWAGLRSFVADRAPVVGSWPHHPGFHFFAGQGGFGIETAPALAALGAAIVLGGSPPPDIPFDPAALAPTRFT